MLCAMEYLTSGVVFLHLSPYYQMNDNTINKCVKEFCSTIVISTDSFISNSERLVSDIHYRKYKVKGMFGSLDCMHIAWHMCPYALMVLIMVERKDQHLY